MARTDFTTLLSTVNYTQESPGNSPLVVGMKLGHGPYSTVNATGGLFYCLGQATGLTTDKWFAYDNASQLIADLNSGLSGTSTTFNANFVASFGGITGPSRAMIELSSCLSTLAYGCSVVIFGSYKSMKEYQEDPTNDPLEAVVIEEQGTSIDLLTPTTNNLMLGMTTQYPGFTDSSVSPTGAYDPIMLMQQSTAFNNCFFFHAALTGADFSIAQDVTFGVDYSNIKRYSGLDGRTGTYYNLSNGSSGYTLTSDQLTRTFCVLGKKTTEWQFSSGNNFGYTDDVCTVYSLLAYDAAGAMARAKSRNELFYSIAGVDRSKILNANSVTPSFIQTNSTPLDALKTNRVNYYLSSSTNGLFFLGSDVVGSTGTIALENRFGPAYLKAKVTEDVYTLGEPYMFQINNSATRSNYTTTVENYLQNYSNVLQNEYTQVICDETNNTDNSSSLNITVTFRPLISNYDISVTVSLQS